MVPRKCRRPSDRNKAERLCLRSRIGPEARKIAGGLERSDRIKAQRALRAEAAHAPKRVYQEHENVKRSQIAGGLERSDRMKRSPTWPKSPQKNFSARQSRNGGPRPAFRMSLSTRLISKKSSAPDWKPPVATTCSPGGSSS